VVDATGSYAAFWPVMLVVGVIAAVANWVTRPMKTVAA
jgi:hypothetical protein